MPYLFILLGTVAASNMLLGLFVFSKAPKNSINNSFLLMTLGIATFVLGILLLSATGVFFFDKLVHYGALIAVFGFYRFSILFPNRIALPTHWKLLALPILLTALLVVPFNFIVSSVEVTSNGKLVPEHGPFMLYYSLGLLFYTLVSLGHLVKTYIKARGKTLLQLQYVLLGIGLFMFIIVLCNAVLPAHGHTEFAVVCPAASLLVVVCTAYAIVRHQLMDIRVVIQRSIIFLTLLVATICLYVIILTTLNILFGRLTTLTPIVSGILTTLIGIFTAPYLDAYFRKITDPLFFKQRYIYSKTLRELSEILNKNVKLEVIRQLVTKKLTETLKSDTVEIRLFQEREVSTTTVTHGHVNMVLKIPIRTDGQNVGFLFLGEKQSEEPYYARDIRLLETLSNQLGTALQRALLYRALEEHSQILEEKVAARTAELRESHQLQRQMLIDISHGLKSPIAVIKTELLSLTDSELSGHSVRTFSKAITGLSSFINDLLRLAEVETRSISEDQKIFNLSELLETTLEYVYILANEQSVHVHTCIKPNILISGVPKKIEEMLLCLLGNAMKYKDPSRRNTIHVTLYSKEDCALLEIEDTGIGIDIESQPKIFKRFYRSRVTRGKYTGTGLGLAIAKTIIEKHSGNITAESTPGIGSLFSITFPLFTSNRIIETERKNTAPVRAVF